MATFPYRFGRRPRAHDPRIPRYRKLTAAQPAFSIPDAVDYTAGLPAALGMYGNDQIGDCTCAALYHALQVWSFNGVGTMDTEPDRDAVLLYEQACGYNPADPSTDQGGIEQSVLAYAMNTGLPIGADGSGREKIAAYVEVDPSNHYDLKAAIFACGVAYIGINVPNYLMASGPPDVWDTSPSGDNAIEGGHAIILAGYDTTGAKLISWGRVYTATWAFLGQFCEEAYAVVSAPWVRSTGATPCGMTLSQLEAAMTSLKEPG